MTKAQRRRGIWAAQLIAYVLIVAVGVAGFQLAARERADSARRGLEHRQVTANVVCGIHDLIVDLVTPPVGRKLTPTEQAQLDAIKRRLVRFQAEQLSDLNTECEAPVQ